MSYASSIRVDFPELATGVLRIGGLTNFAAVDAAVIHHIELAKRRLSTSSEGELVEIQAWRRAFGRMGLKPTQYRCASEALLRRLRKSGDLPAIHPLVDLCNSISAAFAIPIAIFDLDRVEGHLQVRPATGTERYQSFGGDVEHPEVGEIIFADDGHRAHARRWVNRQSAHSAVSANTRTALVVAEAMHDTAEQDLSRLIASLTSIASQAWPSPSITRMSMP